MISRKRFTTPVVSILLAMVVVFTPGQSGQAFAGWFQPEEFPVWESTGLDEIPPAFYDNGLVKVQTVYMRELFLPKPSPDRYIPPNDWSVPDLDGIKRAARKYADEPIVILDIEAETARHEELAAWDVADPEKINGAIWRYQVTMAAWREENPDQIVCLYGFPRGSLLSDIRRGRDMSYFYDMARLQKPITDLADCLTPVAYYRVDDANAQLRNWEIKAEICKEIYRKTCLFTVTPFNKLRDWQQHEAPTIRYIVDSLKRIDGVDGIIFWAPSAMRTPEYNEHLRNWRHMRGLYNYPETEWLRELNRLVGNPYDF
jgi:hypothetical protein